MWPYYPELLETPVPRYTSYPTAADFDLLPACHYRSALERTEGEVSLYLHIPFCEQICFYCGCNTGKANRRQRLESYLHALHREIETVGALLPRGTHVRRVAFGGGSPNAIAPAEFLRLLDALAHHFELDDPIFSIELDPRTMSREWAQALCTAGVERASLGVQTFATHCQQAIGRLQPEDQIVQTVDRLRESGVASINFDLMYGLPGQTLADLEDSMHRTRVLDADRVALFGYAHVPHVVPRQRMIDASALPGRDARFEMAAAGFGYFLPHGYLPVGFDHFAKAGSDPLAAAVTSGRLRRNFQGFTDDPSDVLIGLGASAISSFAGLIAQNEKNSGRYRMKAGEGQLTVTRGIHRSADDRYRGSIIEKLLCEGRSRVGARMFAEVAPRLSPFIERRLVSIDREWLRIEPDGLPYARTIASFFDAYRSVSPRQFSSAV